jgi:4-amino-4-deoxy-L-arabinose transferase-like glycosyltransferase
MKNYRIWIAFLVLLAVVVRSYHIRIMAISNDEIISLACANGQQVMYDSIPVPGYKSAEFNTSFFTRDDNLAGTVQATIRDNGNAILYYLFLNVYSGITGNDAFLARIPSILFQAVVLIILFLLVYHTSGFTPAIITGLIFALHPYMLPLSYYIRGYSLAVLLSVGSTALFLRIVRGNAGHVRALLFGLCTGLALLAHYMVFIIPVGMLAYMLLRVRNRIAWMQFMSGGVLASVILGVWLYTGGMEGMQNASRINERLIERSEEAAQNEMVTWPVKTYSSQAVIPVYRYFAMLFGNDLTRVGIQIRYIMIMLVIAIGATLYFLYKLRRELPDLVRLSVLILLSSLSISTFVALKSGHMTSFEYTHYMMPFSIIVLGFIISKSAATLGKFSAVARYALLANMFIIPVSLPAEINSRKPPEGRFTNPFATAAARIERAGVNNDLLVYGTWYDAVLTNLYLDSQNMRQVVDASAGNRILVQSSDGKTEEIINLKGQYK